MKEVLFRCTPEERETILAVLGKVLAARPKVMFAYAYGSFLENRPFHDIDVGVYVTMEDKRKAGSLSLDLPIVLEYSFMHLFKEQGSQLTTWERTEGEYPRVHRLSVDVRVLNWAPVSFCYHVLCGRLLSCHDENVHVHWAEQVISRYLDLKPLRHRALKEAMASWD